MSHAMEYTVFALSLCFLAISAGNTLEEPAMSAQLLPETPDTVTYIGHATVLLRLNGITVLTDPVYTDSIGPYRRRAGPGVHMEKLPPLDVILISHGHFDHLNKWTLKRLHKGVAVIVPSGLQPTIRGLGFKDVRGLKSWETTTFRDVSITAVPVQHWGTSCGYVIRSGKTVYFAGDTGLFDGMRTIGARYSIDLALLPIGGYRPHLWFIPGLAPAMRRVHMRADDVPAASSMLGANLIVPIHWGTFKLTGEPIHEPLERLKRTVTEHGVRNRVRVLTHGETTTF